MGMINIDVKVKAYSMSEAFDIAQEEAEEQYGRDSYNGQINNCVLRNDISYMDTHDRVDYALNNAGKREVYGWVEREPVHNSNKVKSRVNKVLNKGTRYWKTTYTATDKWTGKVYAESHILANCINKARELVEKDSNLALEVKVEKKLAKGSELCATVEYKRSSNQRPGLYRFVGFAPY